MSAEVIDLDSKRKHITEVMVCLVCRGTFLLRHPTGTGRNYWPHPEGADPSLSCDEVASVPEWTLRYGR